jgi:hypothetical protein
MLQGLSRFLVQHERCGAGFDVAHPAGLGSGRVSITCRGCGARHEYATATIEVERELKIEPAEGRGQPQPPMPPPRPEPRAPIPPRPAPYPESTRRQGPATPPASVRPGAGIPPAADAGARADAVRAAGAAAPPAGGRVVGGPPVAPRPEPAAAVRAMQRFWRSPRGTLALVVVAAVALGIAVVRLVNSGSGSTPRTTQPTPLQAPTATPTPTPAPSGSAGGPVPAPEQPSTTTLRTRNFTLQAPAGWTDRTSSGGLLLQPRGGGRVNVQVFFQRSPGLSRDQMAHQTARFLRREVPGASLFPTKIRIGGLSANEITARGPGETAIAVDLLRGPYRYLLLRRIFAGATPQLSLAASRVVLSFRPR